MTEHEEKPTKYLEVKHKCGNQILPSEASVNYGFLQHENCQVTTDLSLLSNITFTHN